MNSDNIEEYSFSCTLDKSNQKITRFFQLYKTQISCVLRQIASEEKNIKYLGDIDIQINEETKLEIVFSYECSEDLNNSLMTYVRSFLEGKLHPEVLEWLEDPQTVCRKYGDARNYPFNNFSAYYKNSFKTLSRNLEFRIYEKRYSEN